MRFATTLIIAALIALTVWQQQRIDRLVEEVDNQNLRVQVLEDRALVRGDATELFYKLIVANRKEILDLRRHRKLTVTAYSPRMRETDDTPTITASNNRVRQGIVAVSRDLFDAGWVFGKKVYIKGHGVFTIDDLMAASKRNQIDIFMHDTSQAERFGRQVLEAHLIDL